MKRIALIVSLIFVLRCGNIPYIQQPTNPSVLGGAGAVTGVVAKEVVEDIKETSKLAPYLKIPAVEVCRIIADGDMEGWGKCIITPCESNCEQFVRLEDLDLSKIVVLKRESWKALSSAIKAACFSPIEEFKNLCVLEYKNYQTIEKVFIVK